MIVALTGQEEKVLFRASELWCNEERVKTKAILSSLAWLEEGRRLVFDAVPCEPVYSNDGCLWIATLAFRGKRPVMHYDDLRLGRSGPNLEEMKMVVSNPHSMFLCTVGHIMKILSPEFGLVLARINDNRWERVLFHRSQAMIFSKRLVNTDLTTIYKGGDKLRLVAALAPPKKFVVGCIASEVHF